MTALQKQSRRWRSNAVKAGATYDPAMNVIQLNPNELPDYDENETDEDIRRKLALRFQVARGMTLDALNGNAGGVIMSGPPGVGKSHEVMDVLRQHDPDRERHKIVKGYIRATALYKLLYERRHPGNVTVFDDADTIYRDETSLQFLKIATDTVDERIITYGAEHNMFVDGEPIPNEFDFQGSVIFITNINFDLQIARNTKLTEHLEAMVSRSHYIDLGMRTKRDYLIRIFDVVEESGMLTDLGLNDDQVTDVLDFIDNHQGRLRELSLRMAVKLGQLCHAGNTGGVAWTDVARITCCRER